MKLIHDQAIRYKPKLMTRIWDRLLRRSDKAEYGMIVIYRTDTGQPVSISSRHIAEAMMERRPDGRVAFTIIDPGFREEEANAKV